MKLRRDDVRLLFEIVAILGFSFALYVAMRVLGEPGSIFAYGRF